MKKWLSENKKLAGTIILLVGIVVAVTIILLQILINEEQISNKQKTPDTINIYGLVVSGVFLQVEQYQVKNG